MSKRELFKLSDAFYWGTLPTVIRVKQEKESGSKEIFPKYKVLTKTERKVWKKMLCFMTSSSSSMPNARFQRRSQNHRQLMTKRRGIHRRTNPSHQKCDC